MIVLVTVQAMHLYIQNAKTTHFRYGGNGWFRACWGSRPKPWRTRMFWVTQPSGLRRHDFFKIPNEGFNFAEIFGEVL